MKASRVSLRLLKGYSENEMYAIQRRPEHYMRSLLVTGGKKKKKKGKKRHPSEFNEVMKVVFVNRVLTSRTSRLSSCHESSATAADGYYTVVKVVSRGHAAAGVCSIHRSVISPLIGLKVLRTQNTIAGRLNLKNRHYLCAAEKPFAYCRFSKLSYGD